MSFTPFTAHFSKQTDIIGVPYNFGQPKLGTEKGPTRLRQGGFLTQLTQRGYMVNDLGDIKFDKFLYDPTTASNVRRPRAVGAANKKVADAVEKSVRAGNQCIVLGGDHSLAIGSISGHARVRSDLGVVWVDAHADINPPKLSPSGNVHGMPLAFVLHELRDAIPSDLPSQFAWLQPCIHMRDVAYIGLRDVDAAEQKIIENNKMVAYTMKDVRRLGIEEVVKRAIEHVSPNCSRPIHVSFDVDAIDPAYIPSTGTAVSGGLDLSEAIYIMKQLASTGKLAVLDVAEVNPDVGSPEDQAKSLDSCNKLVAGWFNGRKLQN